MFGDVAARGFVSILVLARGGFPCTHTHWCITNLYSKAIELVCGGFPIVCVLVECKAQPSAKWEQQQHRTSLDQISIQCKSTVMVEINGHFCQLPVSTLKGFPLYEVH